jgi:hypothetical protein
LYRDAQQDVGENNPSPTTRCIEGWQLGKGFMHLGFFGCMQIGK